MGVVGVGWGGGGGKGGGGGERVKEGAILYATLSPPGCVCSKVGSDVSHVECRRGVGVGVEGVVVVEGGGLQDSVSER